MKELAIVIPAYNEQDNIQQVIAQWAPLANQYNGDLIIINDGSRDQTLTFAKELSSTHHNLKIIDRPNSGHGASCLYGYHFAIENNYQWVFQTDSDNQTTTSDFHTLWKDRNSHQFIFGYRPKRQDGLFRQIVSRVLALLILLLFQRWIKDANVPYRLMKCSSLEALLPRIPATLFLSNAYLSIIIADQYPIKWHPIEFAARNSGIPSVRYFGFFSTGLKVAMQFLLALPLIEICSILLLALPYFIFWFGWLRWYYALALFVLMLYALRRVMLFYWRSFKPSPLKLTSKQLITLGLVIVLVLAWIYWSGIGAYSFQNGDYQKHNAMIRDLSQLYWPVSYTTVDPLAPTYYLSYYIAYYLPAALIGKATSAAFAGKLLFWWSFAACLITIIWLFRFTRKFSPLIPLFFIFFSGMDILGVSDPWKEVLANGSHIEWWSGYGFWQYSANTSLLFWVPQHALSGWLLSSLLYDLITKKTYSQTAPFLFIFSLSALWSPFVMIGLTPLLILLLIRKKRFLSIENILVGGSILLFCGLYYWGNVSPVPQNFIWKIHPLGVLIPKYLLFCLLEFLLLLGLSFSKDNWQILLIILLTLLLIPLYTLGYYNDFGMRSSIPALFILQIFVLKKIFNSHVIVKTLLICLLAIGAITPITEITRAVKNHGACFRYSLSVPHIQPHVAKQYFSTGNSFFFRYLAKNSEPKVRFPIRLMMELPAPD